MKIVVHRNLTELELLCKKGKEIRYVALVDIYAKRVAARFSKNKLLRKWTMHPLFYTQQLYTHYFVSNTQLHPLKELHSG